MWAVITTSPSSDDCVEEDSCDVDDDSDRTMTPFLRLEVDVMLREIEIEKIED